MKYLELLIVLLVISCGNVEDKVEDDAAIIIQATYDRLEEWLIGIPPPLPKSKWVEMDSIDRDNYIEEFQSKQRGLLRSTCFAKIEMLSSGNRVRSAEYKQVYNLIIDSNLYEEVMPQDIVELVRPGCNNTVTACPEKYRIPKPHYLSKGPDGQLIPEHVMVFSAIYFDPERERAILLAGFARSGLDGEGGLFLFQKLNGRWRIVDYEAKWVS